MRRAVALAAALALWLVALLAPAGAAAQAPAALALHGTPTAPADAAQVSGPLPWSLLEDPGGTLDFGDVLERADFGPARAGPIALGYTASAWWLRAEIAAGAGGQRTLVVRPARLEQVQLWHDAAGPWQALQAGTAWPHTHWPVDGNDPSFALVLPADRPVRLYLRVASRTSVSIDARLCEPAACRAAERAAVLSQGGLLAGFATLATLALVFFGALRRPAFLWLAAGCASYGLYEAALQGFAFRYLWPDAPEWSTRGLAVLACLALQCHAWFIATLFRLWRRRPRGMALLATLLAANIALTLVAAFGDYRWGTSSAGLVAALVQMLLFGVALDAWRDRLPQGRLATAGMALTTLGLMPRYVDLHGWAAMPWLATYGLALTVALYHAGLLAAIYREVIRLRRERWQAQKALLRERGERQQALEHEVAQRTGELQAALAESRALHRHRNRMLAYIGHDLRAPLAATVDYLRRDDADRTSALHEAVEHGVRRQLELIDQLVDVARGDAQTLELLPAPTYLHSLLLDTAEAGRRLAAARGLGFRLDLPGADEAALPAVVVLDARRFRQVLENLLSNAVKFSPHGTVVLRGRWAARQGAGTRGGGGVDRHDSDGVTEMEGDGLARLRFEVEDTGPGIAADEMKHLFEPFWRAEAAAGLPGSGLGLAIAKQIVEAHGGRIAAHSTPGRGSCFVIDLAPALAREDEVLWPQAPCGAVEPVGTGRSVLLVEADATARDTLAEMIYAADFDLIAVGDAEAAQARLAGPAPRPDLLVWGLAQPLPAGAPPALRIASRPVAEGLISPVGVLYRPVPGPAIVRALAEAAATLPPGTGPAEAGGPPSGPPPT